MSSRDESALIDIHHSAQLVISFLEDIDREVFESDLLCQSAVIHQLTIIGEATKRISQAFRNSHPRSALAGNGWHARCAYSCLRASRR